MPYHKLLPVFPDHMWLWTALQIAEWLWASSLDIKNENKFRPLTSLIVKIKKIETKKKRSDLQPENCTNIKLIDWVIRTKEYTCETSLCIFFQSINTFKSYN